MNEFSAKKLGEVLAFAKVGNDTIEKAKKVFCEFLSESELEETVNKSKKHIEIILDFAKNKNVLEIVESKSEKTSAKITSMRDAYIGDEWDNPSEIFEWWGFFGGGAIVHWNLVKGVAEEMADDTLVQLCYDAIAYHESLYDNSSSFLTEIGRKKAKA